MNHVESISLPPQARIPDQFTRPSSGEEVHLGIIWSSVSENQKRKALAFFESGFSGGHLEGIWRVSPKGLRESAKPNFDPGVILGHDKDKNATNVEMFDEAFYRDLYGDEYYYVLNNDTASYGMTYYKGVESFLLFVLRDSDPQLGERDGKGIVNTRIYDSKKLVRSWISGAYLLHTSQTQREGDRLSQFLFGVDSKTFMRMLPSIPSPKTKRNAPGDWIKKHLYHYSTSHFRGWPYTQPLIMRANNEKQARQVWLTQTDELHKKSELNYDYLMPLPLPQASYIASLGWSTCTISCAMHDVVLAMIFIRIVSDSVNGIGNSPPYWRIDPLTNPSVFSCLQTVNPYSHDSLTRIGVIDPMSMHESRFHRFEDIPNEIAIARDLVYLKEDQAAIISALPSDTHFYYFPAVAIDNFDSFFVSTTNSFHKLHEKMACHRIKDFSQNLGKIVDELISDKVAEKKDRCVLDEQSFSTSGPLYSKLVKESATKSSSHSLLPKILHIAQLAREPQCIHRVAVALCQNLTMKTCTLVDSIENVLGLKFAQHRDNNLAQKFELYVAVSDSWNIYSRTNELCFS